MKKPALFAAGTLLLAGALAGCGGSDAASAPKDADKTEFCTTFSDIDTNDVEGAADKLEKIGTPEGIPADARAGFEYILDNRDEKEPSQEGMADVTAFMTYAATECAAELSGVDPEDLDTDELEEKLAELTESPSS